MIGPTRIERIRRESMNHKGKARIVATFKTGSTKDLSSNRTRMWDSVGQKRELWGKQITRRIIINRSS